MRPSLQKKPAFRAARRRLVLAAPAILVAGPAMALEPTPPQTEGPFYPRRLPSDRDADLTQFGGGVAPGEVMELVGQVLTRTGEPAAGAVVEIWHCDPNGVYAHVGFRTHPHFQGYGALRVGSDGAYRFRTTRPGLYPGRTRHIHMKAASPSGAPITTQMYFPGEPDNARDGLLRRVSDPTRLIAREESGPPPRYVFDIVLA